MLINLSPPRRRITRPRGGRSLDVYAKQLAQNRSPYLEVQGTKRPTAAYEPTPECEHPLTMAQMRAIDDAPALYAYEDPYMGSMNPDLWTEEQEREMLVNGYLYELPWVERQRIALARRRAAREAVRRATRVGLRPLPAAPSREMMGGHETP